MYKIQTLNKISPKGLDLLSYDDYDIATEIVNPDAVLVRSFSMLEMEIPASVKAIARAGAGVNNIPVASCTDKGIVVFNTPGANANAVKELVLTGMFMASRRVVQAVEWTQTLKGKGDEVPALVEKGKANFVGHELLGKKLGVIGLGAIGVMVANDAMNLGMEVSGYDPFISVDKAWELQNNVKKSISLDYLLSDSDYISVHVPLTDNTKGMFNRERFALMKKGTVLLNFARGGLVNNKDLKQAIADGIIARYVTDFPDDELLGMEGVICIPHLGASTEEAEENCAIMAVRQLRSYLECGDIINSVNFPDSQLPFTTKYRLAIANRNVPNMVGQISTLLAKEGINIADMLNKHCGEIAYNLINIEQPLSDAKIEELKKIEGIILVNTYTRA